MEYSYEKKQQKCCNVTDITKIPHGGRTRTILLNEGATPKLGPLKAFSLERTRQRRLVGKLHGVKLPTFGNKISQRCTHNGNNQKTITGKIQENESKSRGERKYWSWQKAFRMLNYFTDMCQEKVSQSYRYAKSPVLRSREQLNYIQRSKHLTAARKARLLRNKCIGKEVSVNDSRLKVFKLYTNLHWDQSRIGRCFSPGVKGDRMAPL
ncbi:unnamed protein product [Moneuplotes crassus]|uniref:Uncharacterized protein n=1 Tax=Euplotes crassus TaxID=5936 RepID=A0AAD1U9A5_EUPCR|nr:unnamed protein product [Moneuplotes crassus]